MKKIINRKRYDTKTAQELCCYRHGEGFSLVEEILYRKRTGEYFLYAYGGPMTKYAVYESCSTVRGGEEIRPLTEDEAHDWAEMHIDGDKYEEIFGEVEE